MTGKYIKNQNYEYFYFYASETLKHIKMNNKQSLFARHLLMPFTAIIWYLVVFYTLYLSFIAAAWFFTLNWFWIILVTFVLGGLVMGIYSLLAQIPMLVSYLFAKIYNSSWVSIIIHCLFGLYAVFAVIHSMFFQVQKFEGFSGSTFASLWEFSPFRTILLSIFIFPTILYMAFIFIVAPIKYRSDLE